MCAHQEQRTHAATTLGYDRHSWEISGVPPACCASEWCGFALSLLSAFPVRSLDAAQLSCILTERLLASCVIIGDRVLQLIGTASQHTSAAGKSSQRHRYYPHQCICHPSRAHNTPEPSFRPTTFCKMICKTQNLWLIVSMVGSERRRLHSDGTSKAGTWRCWSGCGRQTTTLRVGCSRRARRFWRLTARARYGLFPYNP